MDKQTAALLLTVAVHVVAVAVLVWAALGEQCLDWRGWWPGDDGSGDPPGPEPGPRRSDDLLLPGAEPSGVRLRDEHERLSDVRRRARRPAHAPEPARPREPA